MAYRLKQKKFGFQRYYPKPKTQLDWKELYEAHKQFIPNIKQITVSWSKKGKLTYNVRKK